jgi:hypothetical protein
MSKALHDHSISCVSGLLSDTSTYGAEKVTGTAEKFWQRGQRAGAAALYRSQQRSFASAGASGIVHACATSEDFR